MSTQVIAEKLHGRRDFIKVMKMQGKISLDLRSRLSIMGFLVGTILELVV